MGFCWDAIQFCVAKKSESYQKSRRALWNVRPRRLVKSYRRFKEYKLVFKVGDEIPVDMA